MVTTRPRLMPRGRVTPDRGFPPQFPDRTTRRHGLARLPSKWVGLAGRVVTPSFPTCLFIIRKAKKRSKTIKKAVWRGPWWAARREPPSLLRQNDLFMTTSSDAASPSALHIFPCVTHLAHFWPSSTLGLLLGQVKDDMVGSNSHADNFNIVISITVIRGYA